MKSLHTIIAVLVPLLFLCGAAQAKDGFEGVACGQDIPKALKGQTMSNEPVEGIEARHTAIELQDLGGDEISDALSTVTWSICGKEFMLMMDARSVVRDVLALPEHDDLSPQFTGVCMRNGKETPDIVVAILDNSAAGTPETLAAKSAWTIDETNLRFVPAAAAGLGCPRSGVITLDGGQ